ncbi:endolytic transglycosylase MltG [Aquipuribacter hungaricus]|uniref:Endolytic murein transglycosylase n=1 Tax=Aquipuribacter hungaricus TaxID=545624 RepID=A0ABV7WC25_9MICO
MTYRVTGGTEPAGDAADLDPRPSSPRRAARAAQAQQPADGPGHPADGPLVDEQPVVDDGYGTAHPVHDGHADGGWTDGHPAAGGEAYADGYVEPYADGYAGAPAHGPDVLDDPFADPAPHDVFGDPVSDGYVPVAPRPTGRRRRPRWVGLLVLLLVVGLVGGAGWYATQALRPVLDDIQGIDLFDAPEDYTGAGTGSVEVVVAEGDSGSQIGRTMVDVGVVASVEAFVAAANAEPEFTSVQPGTYTMAQQLPAVDAVAALLDPANRVTNTVVIAEGLRVDQILDRLAEGTGLPREQLQAALDATELPAGARQVPGLVNPAEGFLYPDGYQFGADPTAEQVIATMVARGQEELAAAGVPPERQLEVLTKASLVQGEARLDEDFGKVAQVIENRLADGQPLELDSTVNYATQTFDTRTTDAQRDSASPFNTYRVAGLPPGPIKSPGRQAIEAVAAPTPGPWRYFVTVDLCTGATAFAETYDEHLANVRVLDAWQQANTADDGSLVCG